MDFSVQKGPCSKKLESNITLLYKSRDSRLNDNRTIADGNAYSILLNDDLQVSRCKMRLHTHAAHDQNYKNTSLLHNTSRLDVNSAPLLMQPSSTKRGKKT